ncbi:HAMP domain-containing histidine kinase [Ruminococcaceae bacterium OttesenSCG-928-I18]|nr:HAMP domain-containing histidine kinase [Ruminococcaceae bacterium OttesenSCG-928-I18]
MLKKLRRRLAVVFTLFTGAVLAAALGLSLWYTLQNIWENGLSEFSFQVDYLTSQLFTSAEEGRVQEGFIAEREPYLLSVRQGGEELVKGESWTPKTDRETLFAEAKETAAAYGYDEWMTSVAVTEPAVTAGSDAGVAAEAMPELVPTGEGTMEGEYFTGTVSPAGLQTAENAFVAVVGVSRDYGEGIFTLRGAEGEPYRATHFTIEYATSSNTTQQFELTLLEDLRAQNRTLTLLVLGYIAGLLAGLALLFMINWVLAKLILKPTEEGLQRQADFVAAASHELRSPLSVVRSSLSAESAAKSEAEARKYHRAAEDEAARMSRLVDDLLLLAGGDAGSWKLQREEVDLDTVLIETTERFRPLAAKQQVTLALLLPDETLPRLKGDRDRLCQVMAVLLDNALQYAPERSEVKVEAKREKQQVVIEVADEGPGVPDEIKDRIFERFFRADDSRTDKKHFGLGLSVAREMVQLHKGSLEVRDNPQGGALFVVKLPFKRKEPAGRSS